MPGYPAPSSVTADYLLEERARELMWEGTAAPTDPLRQVHHPVVPLDIQGGTFTGQGFDDYMKILPSFVGARFQPRTAPRIPAYGNATR